MKKPLYLLDTNICIALLQNKRNVRELPLMTLTHPLPPLQRGVLNTFFSRQDVCHASPLERGQGVCHASPLERGQGVCHVSPLERG